MTAFLKGNKNLIYLLFSSYRWSKGSKFHQESKQRVPMPAVRSFLKGQKQFGSTSEEKVNKTTITSKLSHVSPKLKEVRSQFHQC